MDKINLTLIKKNPLTIPVILADKLGIFNKHNLEVNLKLTEDFLFDGNKDFLSGESDGMMGDTTFFFYMLEKGKKALITSTLTRTIYLVGGKHNNSNLDKLKIGVNRAGLFRLFLENDLKDLLTKPEIVWINNTYERMKALDNEEIDALVAIEPFVSDVLNKGGNILWSSRNSDKTLVMWCFDEEFCINNPEAIKNFHKALEEAGELFNKSSSEEKIRLAEEVVGYSKEVAEGLKSFTFEKQNNYSKSDFELCQEWMYREGEISKLYCAESLIVDTFN